MDSGRGGAHDAIPEGSAVKPGLPRTDGSRLRRGALSVAEIFFKRHASMGR